MVYVKWYTVGYLMSNGISRVILYQMIYRGLVNAKWYIHFYQPPPLGQDMTQG